MDICRLILQDIEENVSGGFAGYESPLMVQRNKTTDAGWLESRYGCERKTNHHARARCKIQARIDQLNIDMAREPDPKKKMTRRLQILKWQGKMRDEIGKPHNRQD